MAQTFSQEQVQSLQLFPTRPSVLPNGQYAIKCTDKKKAKSDDAVVVAKVWFRSPPLNADTISRIKSVQLFAESHDQGDCDEPSAGNWTWLELAIFENEAATSPAVKDGIELVWRSHYNNFMTNDYQWAEGMLFEKHHDMFGLLQEGDVIAVRICSRFAGWKIDARNGFLVLDIGSKPLEREPVDYGTLISEVKNIHETILEVNSSVNLETRGLPDTFFRADVFGTGGERPLRVLSLDGGGVRGLSSLHLLKAVMNRVAPNMKPCQVFDMIGGTSTGGLIAIMLGRLEMTVDECIEKYKKFMGDVFKGWKTLRFLGKGNFYDSGVLETVIKDLIRDKLGRDDVDLLDENQTCKIFLTAVRKDAGNNRGPVLLRSYKNEQDISLLPTIKLWEAARATSAAPAYFKPIKVGMYELIDGGMGANNPLGWLWTEVLGVFGPARPTDCFLSIGTGIGKNVPLPDIGKLGSHDVEAGFASIASNSEIIHILFRTLLNAFAPKAVSKKYWRLNVSEPTGVWEETKGIWPITWKVLHLDDYKDVGDLDDIGALDELMKMTEQYLAAQESLQDNSAIEECAKALKANLAL